jgi:hypothetical protein
MSCNSQGTDSTCSHGLYHNLTNVVYDLSTRATEELRATGAVARLVRRAGLAHTGANQSVRTSVSIYGEEAQWMLSKKFGGKNGLWQVPAQLECALTQLSARRVQHSLTIGTFSGWTDIFLTALLRRFSPDPSAYTHLTVDIISATPQRCVQVRA